MGKPSILRSWSGDRVRVFLLAAGVSLVAVVALGWFSDLRQVMHAALLSIATLALLPFLLIAGALLMIALGVCVSMVMAAFGGDDPSGLLTGAADAGGLVLEGGRLLPRYYAHLAQIRHPACWGAVTGTLLGGLALWAAVAVLVVPGETRSVAVLLDAQIRIEAIYAAEGRYPRANATQSLSNATLGAGDADAPLLDGFARPLVYEQKGAWKLSGYQLRSLGYDGQPGADDLCVSGGTRLLRLAQGARQLLGLMRALGPSKAALSAQLAAVEALQCE